jgi:hypothetical protein
MGATWGARRAVALASAFADRRRAFGALLRDKPLHLDTLAAIAAESFGVTLFSFRLAELVGRVESKVASAEEIALQRALTPIAKLTTGKQAVAIASEAVESFGGAGYVEDTGLPRLVADAQVLPIWEGTTNVLSADTLRALAHEETRTALDQELSRRMESIREPSLLDGQKAVGQALEAARSFWSANLRDPGRLEAGARQYAMTLGRSYEALLMLEHAQHQKQRGGSERAAAAARRFIAHGLSSFTGVDPADAALLLS